MSIVKARRWRVWSMSFHGVPKFTFLCGACGARQKVRPAVTRNRSLRAMCMACGEINEMFGARYVGP